MPLSAIGFAALYFTGCALSLAVHPIYGLLTYVMEFYLDPNTRWWGHALPGLRWALIAATVTVVGAMVHAKKLPRTNAFRYGFPQGVLVFIVWLTLQLQWAISTHEQEVLLVLYLKYAVLLWVICRVVVDAGHFKAFLWVHILGCVYLGWIAHTHYHGGRFNSFGGANIDEANEGAVQLVTGVLVMGAVFLNGGWKEKLAVTLCSPLVLNGIILTRSRSAFLALGVGGVTFIMLAPKKYRIRITTLGVLVVVGFIALTNPLYWKRISTIQALGAKEHDVDTGHGRLKLIEYQWEMFKNNPILGYGHRGTKLLSPIYMPKSMLGGTRGHLGRSSHNTFMTMLVEHGLPGALLYLGMLVWFLRSTLDLRRHYWDSEGIGRFLMPAVISVCAAVLLGGMFVDYVKAEILIWMGGLIVVLRERPELFGGHEHAAARTVNTRRRLAGRGRRSPLNAGPASSTDQALLAPGLDGGPEGDSPLGAGPRSGRSRPGASP